MGCFDYFGTPFQKTVPLVYDESVSIAQQIARIFGCLKSLGENMVDQSALNELWTRFQQSQANQDARTKAELTDLYNELVAMIRRIGSDGTSWDPTQGRYNPTKATDRNMFNWLAIHAIRCDELASAGLNCEQLAQCGLTARGLAVYGWWLIGEEYVPHDVFWKKPEDRSVDVGTLAEMHKLNGYFCTPSVVNSIPIGTRDLAHATIVNGFFTDGTVGSGPQATVGMVAKSTIDTDTNRMEE